ncbi:TPA: primosomal protein DnaI [Streptococcus pneumoniae]|uniref:Primosome component (Helicase loader), primosomal protein DnaI n=1 Tax=Streptococcus pneumoniae TaxID=1313 RepID=A0A822RKL7_STREE|nr:primosomal protein DnaI [Streptococcus pneumoniae]CKH80889.1 primosome component (helicase loader)%2C primosomal protein DnaI [Streptococcus pneumoniae]CKI66091.1 primosome component (helicase loader)%2C primosomal protein DnaI [Streptococcus pneumoniae]CKI93497.1 primosome component (helicase loader)%2C primosomal protein DnaI [Streptococcus pneumoniae]CKI94271.1 primosome component (helicase loader)%2C primosomal protein DnaI [Streptococcus pneumoniae]
MESVGDVLKRQPSRFHYQDLVQKIMKDPDVAAFIQQESLTPEELNRSISKFNQYITERDKFLRGDTDYIAKGYKPILVMNHGYADVSYEETPELIAAEKEAAIKNRLKLINLPATLKQASLAQVDLDDLGRLPVFEKLLAFVEQYPTIRKGLYLYGDFGVGKSFMVAALAHDLSEKRGVSSTLLHYPSFVIDVKNAIGDGNVKTLVDEIKLSEVLILDDIGAEQSTAWVRDEILQVILQYRMQENLPTFFTSNFNFEELEQHFAKGKHGNDETWEARRVMERIRYLAEETRLEGVNRR